MPTNRIYTGLDRPDVEVLVDDPDGPVWCEGELRAWLWTDDQHGGHWEAQVQWRRGPGAGTFVGRFQVDQVRLASAPST